MYRKYLITIIVACFLTAMTLLPAYGQAISNDKQISRFSEVLQKCSEIAKTTELIIAHKNGEVSLSEQELADIKEQYLYYLDEAFQELTKPGNEYAIDKLSEYLPQNITATIDTIVSIAKLDAPIEEKIELLMAVDNICSNLVNIFVFCLSLGLYFLTAAVLLGFIGLVGEIAFLLANVNFILALISFVLYPLLCIL